VWSRNGENVGTPKLAPLVVVVLFKPLFPSPHNAERAMAARCMKIRIADGLPVEETAVVRKEDKEKADALIKALQDELIGNALRTMEKHPGRWDEVEGVREVLGPRLEEGAVGEVAARRAKPRPRSGASSNADVHAGAGAARLQISPQQVGQLMELGFRKVLCVNALHDAKGNVDAAAALLFDEHDREQRAQEAERQKREQREQRAQEAERQKREQRAQEAQEAERQKREKILADLTRAVQRVQLVAAARGSTCAVDGCRLQPVHNHLTGALHAQGFCGPHAVRRGIPLPVRFCVHGRLRTRCAECGGSGLCVHGRQRSQCKECGGSGICEHGRQRSKCKECGGSGICEHGVERYRCAECGGSGLCVHGRQRSRCKECGGSGICEHGLRRSRCKECGGSEICEHDRVRYLCRECPGKGICMHLNRKDRCKVEGCRKQ